MLDAYDCSDTKAGDLRSVYETITKVVDSMGAKPVMPPILIPYYYGEVADDDGISAFALLKGGHFTIHTFPLRQCYFVDMMYDGFISEERFRATMLKELPAASSSVAHVDRRFCIEDQGKDMRIDEAKDFGPHYMIRSQEKIELDHNKIYDVLDKLPPLVNMTPIMRPVVITDNVKKPKFISGITMIAESHIALHYDIANKSFFADIFSCSFIASEKVTATMEKELGIKCENVLISRGTKHTNRFALRDQVVAKTSRWREYAL